MVWLRFNKEKKKWEEIDKELRQEDDLYLDRYMYEKLMFAKGQIKRNHDAGGLVVGSEGSGKSSLAGNIMRFMSDDEFDPLTQIIKDHGDAIKVLQTSKRGSALMFDEGYLLFSSTEVMQKAQRDLVKIFSIIRQKNLFFLIVAPSYFRMNSYFALDRTKFMVRVYTKKQERGYFAWFGSDKKAKLYRFGKKEHDYSCVKPNFRGRFTKCGLLENQEYQDIKEKTLFSAFEQSGEKKKQKSEFQIEQEHNWKVVKNLMDAGVTVPITSKATGLSESRIKQIRKAIRQGETPLHLGDLSSKN